MRAHKSEQSSQVQGARSRQGGAVGRTPALLELQRSAGNAAVNRLLGAADGGRAVVQRAPLTTERPLVESAEGLASSQPMRFLEQIFDGLRVDDFRFRRGEQGNLGLNMISEWVTVPLDSGGSLAVHLNCMVRASQLQSGAIRLHVAQFHLTARSTSTQRTIDTHGPSAATAGASIHINTSTQWGRPDNIKALAAEVAANGGETVLIQGLTRTTGYSHPYVKWLVGHFKERVLHAVQLRLGGGVELSWSGDATFS
ncbi:hypothetical protein ABZ027_30715 [Streptomyces sp. NPDC006332]|uniref:hypothetical protein n=1 Tax=Streptomyces sp. NPDC006332 TaxID=3155456 RepID=UPI0033BC7B7D